jgi:hypothetical protein
MVKRVALGILIVCLIANLVACSSSPPATTQQPAAAAPTNAPTTQPAAAAPTNTPTPQPTATAEPPKGTPTSTEGGVKVDEGLFDVTITLPSSFFIDEDMSKLDLDAYSREQGFRRTVVNGDGSVSITMSRIKHNQMMAEMKASIDRTFDELVREKNTPYIEAISSTDGYSTVTVDVDKAGYGAALDLTPVLVGISAMLYQQFAGTHPHCEIIIKDVDSGAILLSVTYPDALD